MNKDQRFIRKIQYLMDPATGAGDAEIEAFYPLAQQIADMKAVYEPLEELVGTLAHLWNTGDDEGALDDAIQAISQWCTQNHPDWQGEGT